MELYKVKSTSMTEDEFKIKLLKELSKLTNEVANLKKELQAIKKELSEIAYSVGISG